MLGAVSHLPTGTHSRKLPRSSSGHPRRASRVPRSGATRVIVAGKCVVGTIVSGARPVVCGVSVDEAGRGGWSGPPGRRIDGATEKGACEGRPGEGDAMR